ncbi:MAG: S9 family peptidase [bacterium]
MVTKCKVCIAITGVVLFSFSQLLGQKMLTVEDIYENPDLQGKSISGVQWAPDGNKFTYFQKDEKSGKLSIWNFDAKSRQREIFIDSDKVDILQERTQEKRFVLDNYIWSPNRKDILFPSNNDLFIYDTETQKLSQLTMDDENERDPTFSPDGKLIAYIKQDNLHVFDLETGKETRLTEQGGGAILVARFDWVYEEEFGIRTGFKWSPDSKSIAFWQLDESNVTQFPITDYVPVHNSAPIMRYPKAGDSNSTVKIGVVDIVSKKITWMDIGANQDIYMPRITWTQDPKMLCMTRLNRDQNHLELLLAEATSGKTNVLYEEQEYKGWIDITDDLRFLEDKKHFIWTSRKSGWKHIYLGEIKSALLKPVTSGEWDVDQIVGISEDKKRIYYTSSEAGSLERHLYGINFNGKGKMQITRRSGTHIVDLSPNLNYFLDTFSDVNTPWTITLRRINGARQAFIEKNEMAALRGFKLPKQEFITVPAADGTELNAFLIKPVDFDANKKYPVLMYNYSGPGSQIVRNQWGGDRFLWHTMLSQKGYIVFGVDNRGTGARGKDFMMSTYKNLGDLESQDHIAAAKWLASQPYIDSGRIGIWGWSYGGYTAALTFLKAEGLFKAGIVIAPVTDWKNYDTIYTERYMLTPEKNSEGYKKSSCLTYVDKMAGNLLLVHGAADDNVHLANTMQLAYALQNARKPFDLMLYPRKLHGIRGTDTRIHLFNKLTEYILENL